MARGFYLCGAKREQISHKCKWKITNEMMLAQVLLLVVMVLMLALTTVRRHEHKQSHWPRVKGHKRERKRSSSSNTWALVADV